MKILKNLFIVLAFISLLFLVHHNVNSQVCGSKEECEKLISETEQKLSVVRSQKNTLASQIQYMDSQIYLTSLKIQSTQQQIADTEAEIDTLGGRIEGVNDSLAQAKELAKLLNNRLYFVNLIVYNKTGDFIPSGTSQVKKFKDILMKAGVQTLERYRFGQDIKGACGQLAVK